MYPNTYLTDSRVSYVFCHQDTIPASDDTLTRIDLTFPNGNTTRPPLAAGLEEQEWHHNYYLPHILPGRERVPLFNKVLYPDIYDHIDATFGQGPDGLFIRLVCKPYSDPSDIVLNFSGQTAIILLSNGDLKVETMLEDLIIPAPLAKFVATNGAETAASWTPSFNIGTNGNVIINTGSVPSGSTLIIKSGRGEENDGFAGCPYWSTYFGDEQNEVVLGSDTNKEDGQMFFTGYTTSPFFPVSVGTTQEQLAGAYDAYLASFKQRDIKTWITFYGGNENHVESGFAVKYNQQNKSVYFVGRTSAGDFPLTQSSGYFDNQKLNPAWVSRGFIARFKAVDGAIEWSSFIGDPNCKQEGTYALEILSNGNIVAGGHSLLEGATTSFPYSNSGFQQNWGIAFLMEFDTDNNIFWSTRLTNDLNNANAVYDIAEGVNNEIWVLGRIDEDDSNDAIPTGTNSQGYHNTGSAGSSDGFVIRFDNNRNLVWSSFIGGKEWDYPNAISTNANGDFFICGQTISPDYPVLAVGDPSDKKRNNTIFDGDNAFVSKYASDGTLLWSRFFKNAAVWKFFSMVNFNTPGVGNCMETDDDGTIYLVGTAKDGFEPLVAKLDPPGCEGENFFPHAKESDAFLTVINPEFFTEFSTFWGGVKADEGRTVSRGFNPLNSKEFILFGGFTNSTGLPEDRIPLCRESDLSLNPYYQDNLKGPGDGFISKIYFDCLLVSDKEPGLTKSKIAVQPNPAGDMITIHGISDRNVSIEIIDISGRIVSTTVNVPTIDEGKVINTSVLPPGVYFVKITDEYKKTATSKFIKI